MTSVGNLFFTTELLIAELIFLFAAPKKEHFLIRYIGAALLCLIVAYFFPVPTRLVLNPLYQLFRFLVLFALTIGVVRFSFQVDRGPMYAACVAGYASQHIAYHVTNLLMHTLLLEDVPNRMRVMELMAFPVVYGLLLLSFGRGDCLHLCCFEPFLPLSGGVQRHQCQHLYHYLLLTGAGDSVCSL